jgi:hypothetical protein
MGWPSQADQRAGQSLHCNSTPPPPGDPGARPAASDPGPAGLVSPCRSASRASWARAGLYCSSGRRGLRTHRARTSSPDRQLDRPCLGSQRHVADPPGGARSHLGPLHCLLCCHVAIPGARVGPRPLGSLSHGGRRGMLFSLSSLLHGSAVVSVPMASRE